MTICLPTMTTYASKPWKCEKGLLEIQKIIQSFTLFVVPPTKNPAVTRLYILRECNISGDDV